MQLRIMHGKPIAIELKVDGKCALDKKKKKKKKKKEELCVLLFLSVLTNIFLSKL